MTQQQHETIGGSSQPARHYAAGQRRPEPDRTAPIRAELRQFLFDHYNDADLRNLCFELNIDYDDLRGPEKSLRIISLIEFCERKGRLEELIKACNKQHNGALQDLLQTTRRITSSCVDELMPNIDFKEAVDQFKAIFPNRTQEGAALILLQDSLRMCGEYCALRIRDELNAMTTDLRPVVIGPVDGMPQDKSGLLVRLASYFPVLPNEDLARYGQAIVNKIRDGIRGGSTVLIEFQQRKFGYDLEEPILGFIDYFWLPLVRVLPDITQNYRGVKFVAVFVIADAKLPAANLTRYCTAEQFDGEKLKILNLPLRNWRQDEIQEWIEIDMGLERGRSAQIASSIYQASEQGRPASVRDALRMQFLGDSQ